MVQQIVQAFIDAIRSGALLQGIITIGLLVFYAFLIVSGRPVPTELTGWVALVIGFYFGGKTAGQVGRVAELLMRQK